MADEEAVSEDEQPSLRLMSDVPRGERLGDQMRLVPGVELVAEIFDVALDSPRRDSELLSALLRGEPAGDTLQDLALTLGESDEIVLLPREIHHWSPCRKHSVVSALISVVTMS